MDNLGLGGGFLSGSNGGLLDLETSIPRHHPNQLGHPSLTHQHHMNMMGDHENDPRHVGLTEMRGSSMKGFSMNFGKGKTVSHVNATTSNCNMSEEDEPSLTEDGNGENSDGSKGKRGSLWQRMKWTDNVIRLLIAVVAFVGDDGIGDGVEGLKRKSGVLQKKGKWKTVSKIMISKGCQVSPQQCEDKFNDLNKRYKRLNDILGRGTSCQVVENPALMDSMPQLSAKSKDDVRKILNSKHLFYKEMCAYHNGQRIPNCHDIDLQCCSVPLERCSKGNNNVSDEEEDAEQNNYTDDDDDDDMDNEDDRNANVEGGRMDEPDERKKGRKDDGHFLSQSAGLIGFEVELSRTIQDPSKSLRERRELIKKQVLQLQEERVGFQAHAFEIQKQQLKWLRYRSKKDRELERLRLENERMMLDNEQMILHLRQKELEVDFRKSGANLDPTSLGIRMEGRNATDMGRRS